VCRRNRFEVAHLTDLDDVGVLAHGVAKRLCEPERVGAHLALVHDRHLMPVEELDGVLDGDDVQGAGPIDQVDERRQSGRLAGPGGPGDQHEAARQRHELLDHRRKAEFLGGLDVVRDGPEHRSHRAALEEDVHPEPAPSRERM
jgi:hypothetical protein